MDDIDAEVRSMQVKIAKLKGREDKISGMMLKLTKDKAAGDKANAATGTPLFSRFPLPQPLSAVVESSSRWLIFSRVRSFVVYIVLCAGIGLPPLASTLERCRPLLCVDGECFVDDVRVKGCSSHGEQKKEN